jgi:hypothetical protein
MKYFVLSIFKKTDICHKKTTVLFDLTILAPNKKKNVKAQEPYP